MTHENLNPSCYTQKDSCVKVFKNVPEFRIFGLSQPRIPKLWHNPLTSFEDLSSKDSYSIYPKPDIFTSILKGFLC